MQEKTYFNVRNIVLVGILAACVFVLTKFISIPIPSPLGKTAISVGNAMCILSALLFGPLTGGLAAGIGNALVDLSDPAWAPEFWITFINKFLMAFVAGLIMHKVPAMPERVLVRGDGFWGALVYGVRKIPAVLEKGRVWLAGLCGALTYCVLYVVKNIISGVYVKGFTWDVAIIETLTLKLPVTLVNAVIATVCGVLLYLALRTPLKKAHVIPA